MIEDPNFCDVLINPTQYCLYQSVTRQMVAPPMEKPFEVDVCRKHAGWIAPDEDF